MARIDTLSHIPVTVQVRNDMLARVRNGDLKPGGRMPSERAVAEEYGVSRMTARAAMSSLVDDGIAVRSPGRGYFISQNPSRRAGSHREDSGSLVAMILPDLTISTFVGMLEGALDYLNRVGYHVLVYCAHNDQLREKDLLQNLSSHVTGLIHVAANGYTHVNADLIRNLKENLPIVLMNAEVPGVDLDVVRDDDQQGSRLAVLHLIDLGHRRIAHLAGNERRFQGYKDALADRGIEFDSSLVKITNWRFEDGYSETKKLIVNNPDITAISACSDIVAAGSLRALADLGVRVPEEFALVGYGTDHSSSYLSIPLTSVDPDSVEIGRTAARILRERMTGERNESPPEKVLMPVQLVIRHSCGINHLSSPISARQ